MRLFFRQITGDEVPVIRNMIGEQSPQSLNVVAPVAVQLAGHAEPVRQLYARRHARPSRVTSLKVPDASVTTNTSKPASTAESAGNATHTRREAGIQCHGWRAVYIHVAWIPAIHAGMTGFNTLVYNDEHRRGAL